MSAALAVLATTAGAKAVTKTIGAGIGLRQAKKAARRNVRALNRIVAQEVRSAEIRQSERALQFARGIGAIAAVAASAGVEGASTDILKASAEISRQLGEAQDQLALRGVFASFAEGLVQSAENIKAARQQLGLSAGGATLGATVSLTRDIANERADREQ